MDIDKGDPIALAQRYENLGYWQHRTLGQLLDDQADARGAAAALIDGATTLDYAELKRKVDRRAVGFHRIGIARGDRVLLQLPNGEAFVVCLFALFKLGALPILAMPAHRENDIQALCRLAEPSAYLVPRAFLGFDYLDLARRVRHAHPCIRHVLVDGEPGPWARLDEIEDAPRALAPPAYTDVALLLLSGGTTGTPKLIPRTHADYLYNATESARRCGLSSTSVYLAALPASHNFTLACPGILGTLSAGGRVVMAATPGADCAFALIAAHRVTHTALVPALVDLWIEARKWDDSDLSSLALLQVGGARLAAEVAAQVGASLGCRLQQVFGMAEGLLCYTRLDDPPDVVLHTQGRPLCPDDELRIVGADGLPVAPGQVGELQVRGPYTIRGYYRAPQLNTRCFTRDGFFRSGDLVRLTPQGNLVVHGRLKEQINRAGEKIAAAEIEAAVATHPDVSQCAVIAVPDARLGERSCAALLAGPRPPSLAGLQGFLRDAGLPRYKLPDQVLIVPSWPLTAIGKIDKEQLVTLAQNAQQTTRAAAPATRPAYTEDVIAVRRAPIEILTMLAEAGLADDYALYERPDEWSIGIGRVATLRVDATQVELSQGSGRRGFALPRLVDSIRAATEAIEVEGWRAYGVACFEFAYPIHGLPAAPTREPLIELFVPACEVRIRDGRACLRAIDARQLATLRTLVEQAEHGPRHPSAEPADEPTLLALLRHDEAAYRNAVRLAVDEIHARRYQKVILSRRIPLPANVDMVDTYRAGRARNTPARSFLIRLGGERMTGFSPETVVEVDAHGWVSTQPLAGTRALGTSRDEEDRLRADLLGDAKEVMEHAVSVKLAHDEVARVCERASIGEFMNVLRRGSVQHLASRVVGRLRDDYHAWDAFEALFPAVTASGIPKQASIDAIRRFEPSQRGWYSGCVLLVDGDGSLDAALVLRSAYQRDGESWLQAGAGIVAQSKPERELEETNEKLACIVKAVVLRPLAADATAGGA